MKKIILIAAMVLGFAVAATAQPRALGVRIGNGGEISYQHTLGNNFLEVDGGLGLGFDGVFNVGATGIYNFMIAQPNWTSRGTWAPKDARVCSKAPFTQGRLFVNPIIT